MFRSEKKNDKKLLEKIEDQEQKIGRYETRLRDVVQAYKSLQKEKDALESTVKALSTTSSTSAERKQRKAEKDDADSPISQNSETPQDPLGQYTDTVESTNVTQAEDNAEEIEMLQEKVSTLSKALSTVTEEKSKMEAAFQADRKLAIQEQEKRLRESDEQMDALETKYNQVEANLKEMKQRLRQQQSELEDEQNNNSLMLKEMQQLLSVERLEKEQLKIQLKEKRDASASKSDADAKFYEKKIQELSEELTRVSTRLKKYEDATAQPSPLLLQLSSEMNGLKKHHSEAILQERQRANEAEETLRQFSTMEEDRIAVLESKLTELSDVVGSYEKLRLQDQQVISNLKERLAQIDIANTRQQTKSNETETDSNQKVEQQEKELKLKNLLRLNWNRSDIGPFQLESEPLTVAELDNIHQNDPSHRACQLEYKQLKDEFENYKKERRLKTEKEAKDSPQELLAMTNKSEIMKEELRGLRVKLKNNEQDYNEELSCLKCEMKRLEEKHRKEVETTEDSHKGKVMMLELQLTKQRERTLQLLADKDNEISRLKGNEARSPFENKLFQSRINNDASFMANQVTNQDEVTEARSVETDVAVRQLIQRQNSAGSEGTLVYYVQQMSHLQSEVASLRDRNSELDSLIRDDEQREEKILEQMNILKEEIRKLERNRSRENANLEYVKNIVLRYMKSDSFSVKGQLTKAIATVLQFSPTELHEIQKRQEGGGWWPGQQK